MHKKLLSFIPITNRYHYRKQARYGVLIFGIGMFLQAFDANAYADETTLPVISRPADVVISPNVPAIFAPTNPITVVAPANPAFTVPTTTPLAVASNGKFCANVLINGKGPYAFLIDSGSEIMTITPALAKECGLTLTTGTMQVKGPTGGFVSVEQADIETVRIAGFTLSHPVCAVESFKLPYDGMIGAPLFNAGVVQLDLAGNQLTTYPVDTFIATPLDLCIPIPFGGRRVPVVAGDIGGIAAKFEIDTGSSSPAEMLPYFVQTNDLMTKFFKMGIIGLSSISGPIIVDVYDMKTLSLGKENPVTFAGPIPAIFLPAQSAATAGEFDGRIGCPVLTGAVLTFDYLQAKMYLRAKKM